MPYRASKRIRYKTSEFETKRMQKKENRKEKKQFCSSPPPVANRRAQPAAAALLAKSQTLDSAPAPVYHRAFANLSTEGAEKVGAGHEKVSGANNAIGQKKVSGTNAVKLSDKSR